MISVTSSRIWNLLSIVNHILDANDMELVSSIDSTTESEQVAEAVKGTFYNIVSDQEFEGHFTGFKLDPSSDPARPTHMKLPASIKRVEDVYYNMRKSGDTTDDYQLCRYLTPREFLARSNQFARATNVTKVDDYSGIPLFIINNAAPKFYTSFDDSNIVFDSYDSGLEVAMQSSKTQCTGVTQAHFESTNEYIPDLPEEAMMYLIEESKAAASWILNKSVDVKAESRSDTQRRRLSRTSWRTNGDIEMPDYGRRSRK